MITTAHENDLLLLNGLMKGDSKAIDAIYDACYNQVRIMIRDHRGSDDDAKDIFQDAMMVLYRRINEGDFNLTCKLSSYLQVVSRNMWRSKSRRTPMASLSEHVGPDHVDLDESVIDQMINNDKNNLMHKHFELLESGCKKILTLFFQKVPMKKIAEQINSTESYVKKRKFICKSRLIEQIKSDPLYKELKNG